MAHESPFCAQYEAGLHTPLKQSEPQHSALVVQALPRVLQVVLSGVQVPPVHVPLQHDALELHAPWSEVHGGTWQTPATQFAVQQSMADVHAAPTPRHAVPLLDEVLVAPLLDEVLVAPLLDEVLVAPLLDEVLVLMPPMPPELADVVELPELVLPPTPVLVDIEPLELVLWVDAVCELPQPAPITAPVGIARAA